ncbi:ATP-binding cassette domain-containing protein [Listeria monocytogenes]|uniref:ATP-binding cassette domain-containing protein n=1 Tax=Listeria monocytogenes TaxID=1639 RepID=UPI00085CAAEE|nr:ATP-binding cassette domain-containing protein [Listeria monocytogenes]EEP3929245.1 ATP-binding cassette domain-containing protein [Listeria monocytogenes serotype 4ab]EAC2627778.1 ATP-binding cassette domain-containing protein [Listeria monocytogenes]EAC3816123.1 ATP-binding cassette domain-containing protein [Listeria monocytogenes]EAC7953770.1 ATP-binding cassette domain-containing protein [Listeria monocytogenes]EAC8097986.1 ATP-binding cassette domain-containing protein [Listeria monoc
MLKTEHISFQYEDGKQALTDVSIDLEKGNIIGLIGANGSGKSTLFMQLLGINKPSDGTVYFEGKPLAYTKKALFALRKKVSIVFQDPDQQIFYSNVRDDVAFALRNLGVSESEVEARVTKVLDIVGAKDFQHKPVQYLSYGQKKRVAIAGALVLDTDWLLLDEPTAGLDPIGKKIMMEIIERLASQGKKILISSHDIDLIYEICDYVYMLKDGSVLTDGETSNVFLEKSNIELAGLVQPWLIKLHQQADYPLFKKEADFFAHTGKVTN